MRLTVVTLLVILTGCTAKTKPNLLPSPPAAPGTIATTREFLDLAPGWRLVIVAPVTVSGSYFVKTEPVKQRGNEITLQTSKDLLGYETAIWTLAARSGGVSIKLTSAELTRDGKPSPVAKPVRAVIHPPKYAHFLRVFYYTRKSASDHDMAILGAAKYEQLAPLTARVRENPNTACLNESREQFYCEWVPAGMAVRPEMQKMVDGKMRWVSP